MITGLVYCTLTAETDILAKGELLKAGDIAAKLL